MDVPDPAAATGAVDACYGQLGARSVIGIEVVPAMVEEGCAPPHKKVRA